MVRKLHLNESDSPISRYQFADFVAKLNEDVDEDTFHDIEVRSTYVNRGSYNEYEIVIFDATGRLNEIGTITYTPNNNGFDITINISYKGNSISDNLTIDNLDLYSTYDYVLKKIVMFYYDYFNNDDNSDSLFGYDESLDEDINTYNSIYAIKRKDKGNKYVKQFSDGYEFTSQFDWIEQYTDKRSADEDARKWSKQIQPGYYVVKLI